MFDPELEQAVAKMQKSDAPMSKADQYLQLKKFSNRQRTGTQSEHQAIAAFIEHDPLGRQLYRKYAQTRGVSVPSDIVKSGMQSGSDIDGPPDGETEHMKTLRSIATAIQTKHPELRLTKSSAMSLALTTEAGKAAYLADRQARLRAA
jgi:hypothetical protein